MIEFIILSEILNEHSKTNNIGRRQHSDARFLRLGIAKEFSFPENLLDPARREESIGGGGMVWIGLVLAKKQKV